MRVQFRAQQRMPASVSRTRTASRALSGGTAFGLGRHLQGLDLVLVYVQSHAGVLAVSPKHQPLGCCLIPMHKTEKKTESCCTSLFRRFALLCRLRMARAVATPEGRQQWTRTRLLALTAILNSRTGTSSGAADQGARVFQATHISDTSRNDHPPVLPASSP